MTASSGIAARLAGMIHAGAGFDAALTTAIEREAVPLDRPARSVLFDIGSACAGLLLLEQGLIRVSRVASDGRDLQLYRVEPGEICVLSVSCLLGGSEYPARGVAELPVRGVFLPAALFDRLAAGCAPFRAFVFRSFSERLAAVVDLAASVTFDHLDRRLARAVLERVRVRERLVLEGTHAELAAEISSARERVTRLLGGWADQGIVEIGRGHLIVRDKERLEAIARD